MRSNTKITLFRLSYSSLQFSWFSCVVSVTGVVIRLEAVLCFQAQFYVANNIEVVIFHVEKKNIEIEIAILTSKTGLHKV